MYLFDDFNGDDRGSLRDEAGELIGRMFFAFGSVELDMDLCFQSLLAAPELRMLTMIVRRLSMKQKMDAMACLVASRYADASDCVAQFTEWHKQAHRPRRRRNAYVHGYWDEKTSGLRLSRISHDLLDGEPRQRNCTIHELRGETRLMETSRDTLRIWRERWIPAVQEQVAG
jgi:hypothetical protein